MRGLGHYLINEFCLSGAIRLKTLDGEIMANFINGRRIKKYEEPLTQEMLEKTHSTRKQRGPGAT